MIRYPYPQSPWLVTGPAILLSGLVCKKLRKGDKKEDAITSLEKLHELMKAGAITEEEFKELKERVKAQI